MGKGARSPAPAAEDVEDQSVEDIYLGQQGSAQRGDAALDDAQSGARGDHRPPPNRPSARAAIAIPRPARKMAKRKRTSAALERTSNRVPRFVPLNTPMITMAARPGFTKPCE